jgi:CBS domain-containing protein
MTPDPVCVDEDAAVDDVVRSMDACNIGQIPVVSAGKVVGIISRVELIYALERSLSQRGKSAEEAV